MEEKKYNILYHTTNTKNGMVYVGVHCTNKLKDGYIGCGVYSNAHASSYLKDKIKSPFIKAVKKYGYDKFKVNIICFFNTQKAAYEAEALIVNEEWVKSKLNYNAALGGRFSVQLRRLNGLVERVIADFENGMSRKELCIKYNVGLATLRKTIGVRKDPPKDPVKVMTTNYGHKFNQFIKLYNSGCGRYELSKKLSIQYSYINLIEEHLGLKRKIQEYIGVYENKIYKFTDISIFGSQQGLFASGIRACINNKYPAYKNWRFCKYEDYKELPTKIENYKILKHQGKIFINNKGEKFRVETTLQKFCEDHSLTPSNIHAIFTGKQKQHKGYRLWQGMD